MASPVPPAPDDRSVTSRDGRAPGTTVGTASTEPAAGTARATDADSGSAIGSSREKGGGR